MTDTTLPLISVVTPSYNQAGFLEETLLSVKNQDYPNLEHIVIDGGSEDRSIEILRHYENQYNLRWFSEPDKGQSDALNKGFRLARGEIIGWVNSDDTYLPGAVSTSVEFLQGQHDIGWVYGDGCWVDKDTVLLQIWKSRPFSLTDLLCSSYFLVQPTVFFRRKVLEEIGPVDLSLDYAMDVDFFLRMGLAARAGYIPRLQATRRLHDEAKTVSHTADFIQDRVRLLDRLFERPDLPASVLGCRNEAYGTLYFRAGCQYFVEGNYARATEFLTESLRARNLHDNKKEVLRTLLLLLESHLEKRWYVPGKRQLRKRASTQRAQISMKWE
jgi:glycosyltransferase involved in cell wall biosynthesis